jgi:hypothetical protein
VLLAMDNKAAQALEWGFLLWPSLLLTLAVALPIAAATNVLKRRCAFDWPLRQDGAASGGGAKLATAAAAEGVRQEPWGAADADAWRAAALVSPGAAPGVGKRRYRDF